jgi:thioredoxin reductase (NADPH)
VTTDALLDVIIVGAGPAGLAAGIAARRRSLSTAILEQGALVNSILHFPTDMVFFTTPELLEIGGYPFASPHEKPTRQEALKYYRRVTDAAGLEIATHDRVESLTSAGGTFVVTSARGVRKSRAVVLSTGAYARANRLGIAGEDLPHVSHYYREPHPHFRERVVVVGGKNSAAEAALDLYRNGAHVTLVHRHAALGESIKYWVKPDIENRIKEGSIAAHFETTVTDITPAGVGCERRGARFRLPADAVLLLTGYHADTALLRSCGAAIKEDGTTPVCDPETFETSVPNLFLAGAVMAGRESGKIFIENGRFHGEVVIREIAARLGR